MGCCAPRPEQETKADNETNKSRDSLIQSIKQNPIKSSRTHAFSRKPSFKPNTNVSEIIEPVITNNLQGSLKQYYQTVKIACKGTDKEFLIAIDKRTQTKRVLKKYPRPKNDIEVRELFLEKAEILKQMDHPNIQKTYESIETSSCYYIASEYFGGVELLKKIISDSYLSDSIASQCMYDIFNGLNYCHQRGIIHSHLKSENLFFEAKSSDSRLKVANFDLSSYLYGKKNVKTTVRDMYYKAPEASNGISNEKSDLWSAGVILHIMITGKFPFIGNNKKDILALTKQGLDLTTPQWLQYPESLIDLLKKLLAFNPADRPSAFEAMNHPWIQSNLSSPSGANPLYSSALTQLNDFRKKSKFEKCILTFIASNTLTKEEEKQLTDLFEQLDTNKDGKLSKEELKAGYEHMDIDATIDIDAIMKSCDADGNGTIEFSEFLAAAIDWNKMISQEKLKKAFKLYDISGDGSLNLSELQYSMPKVPKEELQEFIKLLDKNHDNLISYQEFVAFMKQLIKNS